MDLKDLIEPEHVFVDSSMATKKQVLEELAGRASAAMGIEKRQIFEGLLERERLGSTGVGHGVAIPHTRLETLESIYCLFLKLDTAIDFDAVDDQPVDLICLLLAPTSAGADHLKVLQKVSRVLRDEQRCKDIRAQTNAAGVYDVLILPTQERAVSSADVKSHSVSS